MKLKYILAVLNSKLIEFLFSQIGVMTAGGAYTLKKATIEEFPLIDCTEKIQQPFIAKVEQVLNTKNPNPKADTTAIEKEIDEMVYKLYGLTEEEIEIVDGKANDSGIRKANIFLKSTFVNLIKKRLKENISFFQSMLRREELLFLSL